MRSLVIGAVVAAAVIAPTIGHAAEPGWGYYGGDQGGQRFSAARQITPANVSGLAQAWTYSTGDMASHAGTMKRASFENTPILAEGRLYICSPFNEVSALDPGTGKQLWRFDPKLNASIRYPNDYVCRGVAFQRVAGKGMCAARIYMNTADRRLIALDAASGKLCDGFGNRGTVVIGEGAVKDGPHFGRIHTTSAPVVTHGVVIVGSSIDDNQKVDELRGTVHAYDAITGAHKWAFDPLDPKRPGFRGGAANVWAPMSVDEARGLVILPVSSTSPDFFGGLRPGAGAYANSIVALHVADGTVAWSFQTTHHDVWDYDLPAQPTLGTVAYNGKPAPAVLQPTKQGLLFTINRDTGVPVIPVVERKVPQGGAPGEKLSPTQPFPIAPAPLAASHITPDEAYGFLWGRSACRDMIAAARHDGMYTPPSTQGSIIYPFTGGGTNWGGLAFDESRGIVYVNTSNAMHLVTLIKQKDYTEAKERFFDKEVSPNAGAPFGMKREVMLSPLGLPCNPPPWGQLHAVDMRSGRILWSVPLGTTEDMMPFSEYLLGKTGTPNLGGPIVTAGGLVFIGAAMDDYLRAFDARTGAELWRGRLPAGGQATPMSYVWHGRQYVVIAAGGHSKLGTKRGDQVVAFALPN
ncbi:MAG TPA: pyrroloquinoline quinone-dependent dehydrogenase [Rhizomicrobium sp.]|jgi:quinoprotein glucose dehydrogenase|nr:pyrroloquinoline quinone-dependent dehydrogenase [Rhizomicrobium sp.]